MRINIPILWLIIVFIVSASLWSKQPLETLEDALKRYHIQLTEEGLTNALKNPNPEIRWLAAQKLAKDRAIDKVPFIKAALERDRGVFPNEANIAYALAELGNQEGIERLRLLCSGNDPAVKLHAATYLANLRDDSCLDSIVGLLQSTKQSEIKIAVLSLLTRFRSVPSDRRTIIHSKILELLGDDGAAVRMGASDALVVFGDRSDMVRLQEAIKNEKEPGVRSQMERSLQRLSHSEK